jgi:thiamine pyrophosphate-dependent acetolactate synthase large subunit-like protein
MAETMGVLGIRVTKVKDLAQALDQAISSDRPCVIDLKVDRDAVYPPVAGVWYEPARSADASLPRGSLRQYT